MNIPKIADAMGLIDERHIDAAVDYMPKKTGFVKYLPAAACIAAAFGICVFFITSKDLKISRRPDVTSESVLPYETPLPTEDLYGDMPEPFSSDEPENGQGSGFYATVDFKLENLDGELCEIAGREETERWLSACSSKMSDYTAVDELANLYSFIRRFDIPDETVREILVGARTGSERDDFSDEEIELILSDDAEAVAEHFAADSAIVKGKNLYSPKWLYVHTASDYEKAGITDDDIEKVLSEIDGFGLTDEAREAFEKKLSETMTYTGGALVYNDGTVVYNSKRPLMQKEFTVLDEYYDEEADGFIFYLAANDTADKNIYACFYMYDQLIASGCDSPRSFPYYEAVFRFTDYYTTAQPAPIGAVVRIAWDGLADTEYEILRLPMLSRIQFSDSDSPYSMDEIINMKNSLDSKKLDPVELVEEMWTGYREPDDPNTVEAPGTEPYVMTKNNNYLEEFARKLEKNAPIKYPESVLRNSGGELYMQTGYTLSEEEFAEFMYCAVPQPTAFRCTLPDETKADFSEIFGTPEFKTGNFKLTDEPINEKLRSNCFVSARLWELIGGEFIFARLDEDMVLPDGSVLHGWLFRKADGKTGVEPDFDRRELPEKLEFLNRLSEYYDGEFVICDGKKYRYNRIILTKQNCEDFVKAGEYLGESEKYEENDEDELSSNILEPGTPLYGYGDFILAALKEPKTVGEEFSEDGGTEKVVLYGYVFCKRE